MTYQEALDIIAEIVLDYEGATSVGYPKRAAEEMVSRLSEAGYELVRGHVWEPDITYGDGTPTRVCRGCGRRERLRTPEWVED